MARTELTKAEHFLYLLKLIEIKLIANGDIHLILGIHICPHEAVAIAECVMGFQREGEKMPETYTDPIARRIRLEGLQHRIETSQKMAKMWQESVTAAVACRDYWFADIREVERLMKSIAAQEEG